MNLFCQNGYNLWFYPAFLVLFIVFIAFLVSSLKKNSKTNSQSHALEILNEKFVNKEITEEEYKRKKALISK